MRIEIGLPDGREKQILTALLDLHVESLKAIDSKPAVDQMMNPEHRRIALQITKEWAESLFPDIKFEIIE